MTTLGSERSDGSERLVEWRTGNERARLMMGDSIGSSGLLGGNTGGLLLLRRCVSRLFSCMHWNQCRQGD